MRLNGKQSISSELSLQSSCPLQRDIVEMHLLFEHSKNNGGLVIGQRFSYNGHVPFTYGRREPGHKHSPLMVLIKFCGHTQLNWLFGAPTQICEQVWRPVWQRFVPFWMELDTNFNANGRIIFAVIVVILSPLPFKWKQKLNYITIAINKNFKKKLLTFICPKYRQFWPVVPIQIITRYSYTKGMCNTFVVFD